MNLWATSFESVGYSEKTRQFIAKGEGLLREEGEVPTGGALCSAPSVLALHGILGAKTPHFAVGPP